MDINFKRNFDRLIVIAIVLLLSFTSLTMSAFNMPLQRMQSDRIRRLQLGLKVEPRVYQAARGPYEVKVKDYRDIVYYGTVYLGSQRVPMRVVLDTGSADFWVPDVSCQECNYYCHGLPQKFAEILCESGCTTIHNHFTGSGCRNKQTFNAAKSMTYAEGKGVWSIAYGTGNCGGFRGNDQVDLGGMKIKVTFGQATQLDEFMLTDKRFDGILGLAFQSLSAIGTAPPFLAAVKQGIINEAVFTVFFRRDNSPQGDDGGQFTFGGIDTVNCQRKINYVPLSRPLYFQFEMQSFKFDGWTITSRPYQVISDTGTSAIVMPSSVLRVVLGKLNAKGDEEYGYTVTCGTHPNITFVIGGIEYSVTSKDYIVEYKRNECILMMGALGEDDELWILGDPFIRQYCQIYDMGRKRIGFAEAIQK